MKKSVIWVITILILGIILSSLIIEVQALGISDPGAYINKHSDGNEGIIPIGNIIVGIVRAVGIAISVIMLTIIGIKYIMGSVEEKAQYKQTIWPYIIGAVLIFAGAQLTQIIYDVISKAS